MPVTVPRELAIAAAQSVLICNTGDQEIWLAFDGIDHCIPPGYQVTVSADKAWLWLGDPEVRRKDAAEWNRELVRLQNKHGEKTWKYILDGNLYCPQFGRGREFYQQPEKARKPMVMGVPIGSAGAPRQVVMGEPIEAVRANPLPAPPPRPTLADSLRAVQPGIEAAAGEGVWDDVSLPSLEDLQKMAADPNGIGKT